MSPKKLVQRAALACLALSALAFVGAACGDDDDDGAAAEAEVRAALEEQIAAENSGNVDNYLKHVTDQWLTKVMGTTRDAVKADPSLFQSEDKPTLGDIKVSGDKATVGVAFPTDGDRFVYQGSVDVVKEDGDWKLDVFHVLSAAEVPSASKKVDVALTDFAFGFDRSEITSKDDLVFHVENNGKQYHMMIVSKIPADAKLDELLAFEGDGNPPGVEDVGGIFLFSPGDKADVVLKDKLAAGRYVFICFVADEDDPEHTPHVFKGMVADFEVK